MENLDEYSLNQSLGAIVNIDVQTLIDDEDTDVAKVVIGQGKNESIENGNFQSAQKIREEKVKLIDALSQFPITALWLVHEYGQNRYKAKKSDPIAASSKRTNNIESIKKYFLLTSSSFAVKETWASSWHDEKNLLRIELTKFPYTFEDLLKLVDIIVFAYKYRGLFYQPVSSNIKNHMGIIINRLEGLGRRSKLDVAKFYDVIKTSPANQCDEQFLFLTTAEMQSYFSEIVLAEHFWLLSRQQLTTANYRLVLFIANQYKGSFLGFDDLVQEGQIGLLKAVDRFDYRLGFQFSTYAGYWIRQSISRALSRSERAVRVPCGQVANINKVFRAKEELSLKAGAEVTVKELAQYTKFSEEEINTILSISQPPVSLEDFDSEEENSFAPIDFLEQQAFPHPLKKIAESELENLIAKALKILSTREAKIIRCHFGIDGDNEMTLQDIGSELNLTRERVRQIQVKALNMLKLSYGQQLISFL
jgi:RNA polymerase primary sigma factor